MRNTLKLSLLTILAIPLFIMNVSAKEIVDENTTYQRGTFEYKTYTFNENVEDFQELKINGASIADGIVTITGEKSLAIDWNYLENINNLSVGTHSLSFVFAEEEVINTTLTINENTDHSYALDKIFLSVPTEYTLNSTELDALNYNSETGSSPAIDELMQAIQNSLSATGYVIDQYGYNIYLRWDYYTKSDVGDYLLDVKYQGASVKNIAIHATYSNSGQKNEADAALAADIINSSDFYFVRFVPLIDALEAHRNGNTASLVLSIEDRLATLVEGTNAQFIYVSTFVDNQNYTSRLIINEYFLVVNGILYDSVDYVMGGYVSTIYPPDGESVDETVFAQDYLKEQFLLYELMNETESVTYDAEFDEVSVNTSSGTKFYGYVVVMGTYEFISGANSTVATDESLVVNIDGDSDNFFYVEVDDAEVNEQYYTVSGDTVVSFNPEFTNALSEGDHNLTVYFIDGRAVTTFTITKSVVEDVATSTTNNVVYTTTYTTTTVYQTTETKKEELKEVSEDKKDKPKDEKEKEKETDSSKGGGKGFIIGILIAILIAGIGVYLYKEGQE